MNLLPKAWVKGMVLDLLRETDDLPLFERKQHSVQVLSYNEDLRSVTVSDKETSIAVLLTKECFAKLCKQKTFRELTNCILRLDKNGYHLTGVVSAAGDRNIEALTKFTTLPLALQCSSCSFYSK